MIPSHSHFFCSHPFQSRFIFAEAPQIRNWIIAADEAPEEPPFSQVPSEQDLEKVSDSLVKKAIFKRLQQDPNLIQGVPGSAIEEEFELVREHARAVLEVMVQNAGQTNEQLKQIVLLSVDASTQAAFEHLRLRTENVLLHKENEGLQVENLNLAEKAKNAEYDYLTKLPNRASFEKKLQEEVSRAHRTKKPLSMLMYDLDKFKEVNDAFGHPVGDKVLEKLGQLILDGADGQKILRESDSVGRYGGDEIVFLLPDTDKWGAILAANRLNRMIKENPIFVDNDQGNSFKADVGASIGIGVFGGIEKDPAGKSMFADADHCLLILKGERPDRDGGKESHRGQIAVGGEIFTHEGVERCIREERAIVPDKVQQLQKTVFK